jgi:hypothetical protein
MIRIRLSPLLLALCCVIASDAAAERRRALLIGINDYTASTLPSRPKHLPPQSRDWPNLAGAVTDVQMIQEMLTLNYGFAPSDVTTLTNQSATREAILSAIEEHLVEPAAKDDVVFLYFAGHGSQVRNSVSDEPDKMDESLVPADSRGGAADIRDKELRLLFNRILARGARLTIVLDNCHSGSGARGLVTGARPRGIEADLHDVADPRTDRAPEEQGALVFAAAQDFDAAWETRDEQGNIHGAFSWAFLRAMRDAAPGESASETFLRAQARLRAETPYQEPVMSGNAQARLAPFLGVRATRRDDRPVIAVERIAGDGTVLLQGGWANGLSIGTELRVLGDNRVTSKVIVTALHGLGRSEARMETGRAMPQVVRPGALLEIAAWAAPPGRPLRVWMPRVNSGPESLKILARSMRAEAGKRGVTWLADPTDGTPANLMRRGANGWELLDRNGAVERIGSDSAAIAAVTKITAGTSLFVQFPAPATLVNAIAAAQDGIEVTERAEEADYVLVGRYVESKISYAWVRPYVRRDDRRKTGLPPGTSWETEALELRDGLLRLRRIHAWHSLESPPDARVPYRLGIVRGRESIRDSITGHTKHTLVLRAASPLPPRVPQRYYYAFAIDNIGRGVLLFPRLGSVENRFPLAADAPPAQIELNDSAFKVGPPWGVDTYFLLSTDEPLPNPWILEFDGVRAAAKPQTALEQLLSLTMSGARAGTLNTPANWSLEKLVLESVLPRNSSRK